MSEIGKLLHLRQSLVPEGRLLVSPEGAWELTDLLKISGRADKKYANRSVALRHSCPVAFITNLTALDGVASSIVFLSSALPDDAVRSLMERAGCDELVEGQVEANSAHVGELATGWVMTTSGTTGLPKLVRHEFANLARTVKPPKAEMQPPVWGLLYEPSRMAGLQVVLQALAGGGQLIIPHHTAPLAERLEFFAANACTHLSATPSIWRQILMWEYCERLTLRQITLGGEIADAAVLNRLKARFPDARITHIYASTEIGVGFAVNDGEPGFPISFIEEGVGDVKFKVASDVLYAKPPPGLSPPQAEHLTPDEDGYFSTQDRVEIRGDRVFFIGRANAMVNVGGVKLQLEPLEDKLRTHPKVGECALSVIANPLVGSILKLDVVPAIPVDDKTAFSREVRKWCQKEFPREAVPVKVTVVDQIEISSAGKLKRVLQ